MHTLRIPRWLLILLFFGVLAPSLGMAEDKVSDGVFTANNLWMMMCAGLVFIMHLGFATLETGLTQQKNTVNILFKNTFIVCFGIISYAYIGFNLMYPGDFNGFLGFSGFGLGTDAAGVTQAYNTGYTYWTDFLFQAMFAATSATIVSGAVAERIKLSSFMVFTILYVTLIDPFMSGMPPFNRGRVEQPLPHNRHGAFIGRPVERRDRKLVDTGRRRTELPGLLQHPGDQFRGALDLLEVDGLFEEVRVE